MPPEFEAPNEISIGEDEPDNLYFEFGHSAVVPPYRRTQMQWKEIDDAIDKMVAEGIQVRAIVVERKLGEYQLMDPEHWGVVARLDRYSSQLNGAFKPVKVNFFKRGEISCGAEELLVVYPAKSFAELSATLGGKR